MAMTSGTSQLKFSAPSWLALDSWLFSVRVFRLIFMNHHFLVYSLVYLDWWFPIWKMGDFRRFLRSSDIALINNATVTDKLFWSHKHPFTFALLSDWLFLMKRHWNILCFISMTVLMYVNKRFTWQASMRLTFWITSNPICFLQGLIKPACVPINSEIPSAPWRKLPLRQSYLHVIGLQSWT